MSRIRKPGCEPDAADHGDTPRTDAAASASLQTSGPRITTEYRIVLERGHPDDRRLGASHPLPQVTGACETASETGSARSLTWPHRSLNTRSARLLCCS